MSALLFPTKKLFRTGLYIAPLIALLAIMPLAIARPLPLFTMAKIALLLMAFLLTIWNANMGFTYLQQVFGNAAWMKVCRYTLSFAICISLAVFIRMQLHAVTPEQDAMLLPKDPGHIYRRRLVVSLVLGFSLNTVILIIQDLVLLREKKAQVDLENAYLKLKNAEATNQQLRQQVHPHFLFNSLNTLKSLIRKKPDLAEEYLVRLSDFLRSSVSYGNQSLVRLSEELKLCGDYLEMQKMRFGAALQYAIRVPQIVASQSYLPAFALQLLAENAIKHNALTPEQPLHIEISLQNAQLLVSNNLQRKQSAEPSTGTGLANLSERYRLLAQTEPEIHISDQQFSVSIQLLSHEHYPDRR